MNIIEFNPYRILGIYSNSPLKERLSNKNKLKAFLKIGKSVSFPLDLPGVLNTINRTTKSVDDAESKVTLPIEQIKYAQFWFMKSTPIDEIAMNHLISGNVDMAFSLWEKKDNASSLQNRIVISLIRKNYSVTVSCAEKLYTEYKSEFVNNVLGDVTTIDTGKIEYTFLDEFLLIEESKNILPFVTDKEWSKYLKRKNVQPLLDELNEALEEAKDTRKKGPLLRIKAGQKLIKETKDALSELRDLIGDLDLQYQMIADKIGLEILQCGIDYYNESEDIEKAYKARPLQDFALQIVIGKMAKERCQENVNILNDIISQLPPKEIMEDVNSILSYLKQAKHDIDAFNKVGMPDNDFALTRFSLKYNTNNSYGKLLVIKALLNGTYPHFVSIVRIKDSSNEYYKKMSDLVLNYSLNIIIDSVNKEQEDFTHHISMGKLSSSDSNLFGDYLTDGPLKNLHFALDVLLIMQKFEKSTSLYNRYNETKSALTNIVNQIDNLMKPTPSRRTEDNSGCFSVVLFFALIVVLINIL